MRNLRKSLVRSMVASSLVLAGAAQATPKDDAKTNTKMATRTGDGLVSSWKDLQASHVREFHGDTANLDKMHFSAKQAMHIKGTEQASDARDQGKSDRPAKSAGSSFRAPSSYGAALAREQKLESGLRLEHAAPRGSNEAVSDKASEEMGDIAPSGNDTGDKTQNVAAIAANNKYIPNDFHAATAQMKATESSVLPGKEGQLHLNASQAQQLTQSDESENSSRNMASSTNLHLQQDPTLGTHNNYADATDKVRYAQPVERMAKIDMPSKFFH